MCRYVVLAWEHAYPHSTVAVVCLVVNRLLFSLDGSDLQLIFDIKQHYAVLSTCRHSNSESFLLDS